jgi:DnaJ-class molecular chaperone
MNYHKVSLGGTVVLVDVLCQVCFGAGRLMVRQKVGFLGQIKESSCSCWACKGSGKVKFDLGVNIPEEELDNCQK